jgi:Arc/MetJ family transcription regulator
MRTNIDIDDQLMADAMKAMGAKTKREAVEMALRNALRLARQKEALKGLRGIGWEGDLEAMRTDKPLPEWG